MLAVIEDPVIDRMLNQAAPSEPAREPAVVAEPEPEKPLAGKPSSLFGAPQPRPTLTMPVKPNGGNGAAVVKEPEPRPVAAVSAPAPKGARRAPATPVSAAPANLETAIDDLLSDDE